MQSVSITHNEQVQQDDIRCLVDGNKLQQKSNDFFFAAINADRFDGIIVKGLEVDLGHRSVCTRADTIYECLERVLGYDDLID